MSLENLACNGRIQRRLFRLRLRAARLREASGAVAETVARAFQVTARDLFARSRGNARVALARQVAMYLARVVGGLPLTLVGLIFGRDRTTVAHACAVIESRRDDTDFNLTVDLLEGIVLRLRQITWIAAPKLA